ncbi:wsc domain-containing protein 2, partial [Fusarium sporotrichioides]
MKLLTLILSALVGQVVGLASTDTITWGGDNSRTGYQTNHNMDPAIVGSPQFDIVFKTALPGRYINAAEQIFSQPLVYTPSNDTKQFVYLATTQNNIYKLDAKTGIIIASRNIGIPFLTADLDGCVDVNPTVGVTATGVIDPDTDTWYITSKTYVNQTYGPTPQGRPAGRYKIHAINVNDLSEQPNFPVDLEGTIARNNPERMFTGGIHHQRPGLLHTGQFVYAGFASHCVQYNFTGWIVGWDKTSGKIVERWASEGMGVSNNISGAGIWQSGGGLASDDAGSMFFATGNGYASQLSTIPVNGFTPPTAMEQAAVHMSINSDGTLSVVDLFMPFEKQELDGADKDLGTSPLELLPSQFSCGDIKRMGIVTGKSGKTYWLNLDDLGGYRNGPNSKDRVIQTFQNENSVYAGAGVYPLEGGYIYINVIQYPTHVFKFSCLNGVPYFTKVADSPTNNAYILGVSHGTTTSLNGQEGTGLLWVSDVQNTNFKIYDAVPQNGYLNVIRNFTIVGITKFSRPVFGDGMAYIGTTVGYFYGLGSTNKYPLNCTASIDFGTTNFQNATSPQTINCTALFDLSVTNISLADATNYNITQTPNLPLSMSAGDQLQFSAQFSPQNVGRLGGIVNIVTSGVSDASYSKSTKVRLTGVGTSSNALLDVSPKSVVFTGLVSGSQATTQSILIGNDGTQNLTVTSVLYTNTSSSGPFTTWTGTGNLTVDQFTLSGIPKAVSGGNDSAITVLPNTIMSGNFTAWVKFVTTGGNATVSLSAAAGDPPTALLEFQTPDGSGWVKYDPNTPFTFGNVTENTSKSLRFRISNTASAGGVKLGLTVSKPPFGVPGIVRSANQVDLAEGTLIAPGQSQTATLTCNVPKSQWNVPSYNGTAQWTINTNDPTWSFEKRAVQFFCNAVAEQAAPLLPNGQGQYQYVGCFKENNPGRQLSNLLYANSSNTNEMCINTCGEEGLTFCGTQYRSECWAGNKIPNQKVDDANCNFDCAGSLNQYCGGNGIDGSGSYISLFADTLQWDGSLSSGSSSSSGSGGSSTPKGPFVNPGVDGYTSIGCYTEATAGRALPNGRSVDSPTVAECIDACSSENFVYAGVEYGGECYCGNTFTDGSVPAPIADCGMLCNAQFSLQCYSVDYIFLEYQCLFFDINIFYHFLINLDFSFDVQRLYVQCFRTSSVSSTSSSTSSTGSSTSSSSTASSSSTTSSTSASSTSSSTASISTSQSTSNSMTANAAGGANGYQFNQHFNFQWLKHCVSINNADDYFEYIQLQLGYFFDLDNLFYRLFSSSSGGLSSVVSSGTTLSLTSRPSSDGTSLVAPLTQVAGLSSVPSAGTSLTAPSLDSQLTVPSAPSSAGSSSVAPLSSIGVAPALSSAGASLNVPSLSSQIGGTSIPSSVGSSLSNPSVSSQVAVAPVLSSGSALAGTSRATSTTSSTSTSSASTTVSRAATTSTSSSSTSSTKPVVTGPSISDTIGTWSFQGCWAEPLFLIRALSSKTTSSNDMDLDACAVFCTGYTYFGAENGRECYCGNFLNVGSYQALNQKDCSATCAGDKTQYCGGTQRLQLFKAGKPATGNKNFQSYSCASEPFIGRLLPDLVLTDSRAMTVDTCLDKCSKYKYAGVENGRDCYCGNMVNWQGLIGQ